MGGSGELTGERDSPPAELVADRGESAETDDFFRSRPFYDAEGVTHTARFQAGGTAVALPLLVREIGRDDLRDAISPYGYPGAAVRGRSGSAPDPQAIDWSATGLVSVFARERIGHEPCLAGAKARSVVQIHDPARSRRLRPRFAEQIRRNTRLGYRVETVPGPEASAEQRASFHSVYTETMDRARAAKRYYLGHDYVAAALAFERSWLLLCRGPDGATAAAAIVAASDGLLHYYLGGTGGAYLPDSPFKNVVDAMVALADTLGAPLNLGGGVRAGDGLESFKRGFANAELPFRAHEIVCDRAAYDRLSEGRRSSDFFPAYRAPAG